MKAILRFDLDDAEDRAAHLRCVKALDMGLALSDITEIRRKYKHIEVSDERWEGMEEIFKHIQDILEDHDINIDSLIQ